MSTKHTLILALPLALVACGDDDPSEPDASSDTGVDIADAGTDAPADTGPDTDSDVGTDVGTDADPDADVLPDAPTDVDPDSVEDTGPAIECSDADRLALSDDNDILLGCTGDCVESADFAECVTTCFTDAGIESECAACGVIGAECVVASCAVECDDGTDEACQECVTDSCRDTFLECVGEPPVVVEPTGPLAFFHAVHLVGDVGPIDVYTSLISAPFSTEIPFAGTSGAVEAVGGDASIDFRASGETEILVSTTGEFAFGGGERFTAGAFGTAEAPIGVTIREDLSEPPGGGVRYRYVHAGASLPATVDLWLANEGEPDDTFLEDVAFGDVSADATRPAGPHRISVDLETDGTPDVTFDQGTLNAGEHYTFWITSDGDGPFVLRTSAAGETVRFDGETIE